MIVKLDGTAIDDDAHLVNLVGLVEVGKKVSLEILRDGKTITATVKLIAAPERPPRDAIRIKSRSPFEGALVENVSPAVSEELSLENVDDGVVVAEIAPDSLAANLGVQKGDVVREVNGAKIASTHDLEAAASQRPRLWDLTIERGGQMIRTRIGG